VWLPGAAAVAAERRWEQGWVVCHSCCGLVDERLGGGGMARTRELHKPVKGWKHALNRSGFRPMASEVGAGTFWQAIVDHVTGPPPADPCSTRARPLADSHADPF
jgi:hypothetical protein